MSIKPIPLKDPSLFYNREVVAVPGFRVRRRGGNATKGFSTVYIPFIREEISAEDHPDNKDTEAWVPLIRTTTGTVAWYYTPEIANNKVFSRARSGRVEPMKKPPIFMEEEEIGSLPDEIIEWIGEQERLSPQERNDSADGRRWATPSEWREAEKAAARRLRARMARGSKKRGQEDESGRDSVHRYMAALRQKLAEERADQEEDYDDVFGVPRGRRGRSGRRARSGRQYPDEAELGRGIEGVLDYVRRLQRSIRRLKEERAELDLRIRRLESELEDLRGLFRNDAPDPGEAQEDLFEFENRDE